MKLSQLQELAKKVQLEIKSEETEYLLTSFSKLEEMLAKFQQSQLKDSRSYQKQTKLNLGNLHQLTKDYSTHSVKQEIICHNAVISAKNFLIVRKKGKASNFVK